VLVRVLVRRVRVVRVLVRILVREPTTHRALHARPSPREARLRFVVGRVQLHPLARGEEHVRQRGAAARERAHRRFPRRLRARSKLVLVQVHPTSGVVELGERALELGLRREGHRARVRVVRGHVRRRSPALVRERTEIHRHPDRHADHPRVVAVSAHVRHARGPRLHPLHPERQIRQTPGRDLALVRPARPRERLVHAHVRARRGPLRQGARAHRQLAQLGIFGRDRQRDRRVEPDRGTQRRLEATPRGVQRSARVRRSRAAELHELRLGDGGATDLDPRAQRLGHTSQQRDLFVQRRASSLDRPERPVRIRDARAQSDELAREALAFRVRHRARAFRACAELSRPRDRDARAHALPLRTHAGLDRSHERGVADLRPRPATSSPHPRARGAPTLERRFEARAPARRDRDVRFERSVERGLRRVVASARDLDEALGAHTLGVGNAAAERERERHVRDAEWNAATRGGMAIERKRTRWRCGRGPRSGTKARVDRAARVRGVACERGHRGLRGSVAGRRRSGDVGRGFSAGSAGVSRRLVGRPRRRRYERSTHSVRVRDPHRREIRRGGVSNAEDGRGGRMKRSRWRSTRERGRTHALASSPLGGQDERDRRDRARRDRWGRRDLRRGHGLVEHQVLAAVAAFRREAGLRREAATRRALRGRHPQEPARVGAHEERCRSERRHRAEREHHHREPEVEGPRTPTRSGWRMPDRPSRVSRCSRGTHEPILAAFRRPRQPVHALDACCPRLRSAAMLAGSMRCSPLEARR